MRSPRVWSRSVEGCRRFLPLCILLAVASACGDSRSPSSPTPPPPSSDTLVTGQTTDAVSGVAINGASLRIDGFDTVMSQGGGAFTVAGTPAASQSRAVIITSPETVERQTRVRVPGPHAVFTLIPRSFDLASFNQMFRGRDDYLRRWTSPPSLVVVPRVLAFTSVEADQFTAQGATLSETELQALVSDLNWSLAQMTGGTYTAFASTQIEHVAEGASVTVSRHGQIVVARYAGLQQATTFVGYGRWSWNADGEMLRGIVMLDPDYEDRIGYERRRSLRAHEVGHALGWEHLETRPSVMNAAVRLLPTEFDVAGAALAFRRPPLNRSPDIDPASATVSRQPSPALTWRGAP